MTAPTGPRFPDAPIARTLGLQVAAVDPAAGTIVVTFEVGREFANAQGHVQGGIVAAMLDATMGPALRARFTSGQWAPTTDLHVQFLSAAQPGSFTGRGSVTRQGSTIAFTEAELLDPSGVVVARATGTSIIRRPPPEQGHRSPASRRPGT